MLRLKKTQTTTTEAKLKQNPKNSLSVSAYSIVTLFADFTETVSINEGFLILYSKLEMEQVSEKSL